MTHDGMVIPAYILNHLKMKKIRYNIISKHISINKRCFVFASVSTYSMYGWNFLSCHVKLDFCLKNNKKFSVFLNLILCNIYNHSINIDRLFNMLGNLSNLEKLFIIQKN